MNAPLRPSVRRKGGHIYRPSGNRSPLKHSCETIKSAYRGGHAPTSEERCNLAVDENSSKVRSRASGISALEQLVLTTLCTSDSGFRQTRRVLSEPDKTVSLSCYHDHVSDQTPSAPVTALTPSGGSERVTGTVHLLNRSLDRPKASAPPNVKRAGDDPHSPITATSKRQSTQRTPPPAGAPSRFIACLSRTGCHLQRMQNIDQ